MIEKVKERLKGLGYGAAMDEAALSFSLDKALNTVKSECNITTIPTTLEYVVIDIAAGEFLFAKKTFSPGDLGIEMTVRSIREGDVDISFDTSGGQDKLLDSLIAVLINGHRAELTAHRRMKW